ncbi:WD40 repeat, partial [Arabidopsis thaliana x Arabidopsis arenosa]
IAAFSWIPKGASKAMPDDAESPSKKEEMMDDEIQNSQVTHAKSVAKSFGKPCSKSKGASSSSTDADDVVKFLKELDMDNYDEEDVSFMILVLDSEIELFSSGQGDLYYPSNEMDPYLKDTDGGYDSEDLDDMIIRPTDLLILCASIKREVNYLEVYVYEESGNMYLRHDMIISKVPLCTAWLDCPLKGGEKGNFVAIGSMDSSIEIWDLDLVNEVLPCVQLGRIAGQTSDCHTDPVIDLAWNKEFRNIVASASADKKVKVWDVATGKCKVTMEHHEEKVKAVAWNHYAPEVLLSGSSDGTVVMKDGRDPSHSGLKWSTKAGVESLAWDPHSEHSFVASLEDGTVKGFDIRASDLSPSFIIHAHDGEVSSISYNIHAPNLLATGSEDESVKLWDLSNNQPSWIATHMPNAGEVFSVSFSADCPFLLAVCGSEGINVWDTLSDTGVSRRYGSSRP